MSTDEQITRCLYCSLYCPVAVERRSATVYQPRYVDKEGAATSGGLCYRGHFVSALKAHARRLTQGWINPRSPQPEKYAEVLGRATDILRQASDNNSLGVLISGQMPVQDLTAAVDFFQKSIPARNISIYVPPTDMAMFNGVSLSQPTLGDIQDLDKTNTILALGDVLGTHPMLAKRLLTMRERNRRSNLINLDTMKGRTSRFATQKLIIKNCTEVHAVAALTKAAGGRLNSVIKESPKIDALLETCGMERAAADDAVERLKTDKDAVILLTLPTGRCPQNELLTMVGCLLAQATEAKIIPLYTLGGSPGGLAVSRSMGLTEFPHWLHAASVGDFSAVFIAGFDAVSELPVGLADPAWDKIGQKVVATAVKNPTAERADVVLPLSFWFEMTGHTLDYKGNRIYMNPVGPAPGAAGSLGELIAALARAGGIELAKTEELDLYKAFGAGSESGKYPAAEIVSGPKASEDAFLVAARTENIDLYDGELSRQLDWVVSLEPQPAVLINPADAAEGRLKEFEQITLGVNGSQAALSVRLNNIVPRRTALVSSTLSKTRQLFDWRVIGGTIEVIPTLKKINPVSTEDQ